MKEITSKWRQFLLSESQNHYEVEILLKYAGDMSLYGDVFNKIRAIPGVTIVKRKEEDVVQSVGDQKMVRLNVKFFPRGALFRRYLDFLKTLISKINHQDGDKVMGVRFLSHPSTTEK